MSLLLIAAFLIYLQEYWSVVEDQIFGASIIAVQPLWCLKGMNAAHVAADYVKTPPKFPDIWRLCVSVHFEPREPPFSYPSNIASCFFVGCFLVSMWFYNTFLKTVGFNWDQWQKATTKAILPLPPEATWEIFQPWHWIVLFRLCAAVALPPEVTWDLFKTCPSPLGPLSTLELDLFLHLYTLEFGLPMDEALDPSMDGIREQLSG